MILNGLKTILRNLYRDPVYSLINIIGLSIGIACCIVLGLYLYSELTYDKHFSKHERIYRISSEISANGTVSSFAQTAPALGPLMAADNSQIEAFVRINLPRNTNSVFSTFTYGENRRAWDDVLLADYNIFHVFDHRVIFGDPETALLDPNSIAVSESFSQFYFGDENPVGRVIEGSTSDHVISLVFANLPDNTHLKYDALLPYRPDEDRQNPSFSEQVANSLWYARWDYTYILMPEGFNPNSFATTSDDFYNKYMASLPERFNSSVRFFLEPLHEIHLRSTTQGDQPRGSMFYVFALLGIAIFVLSVAAINYMNLATARLTKRNKEISIRKLLGAQRHQLIGRFLGESLFFATAATLLGLVIVNITLQSSPLNSLLNKSLSLVALTEPLPLSLLVLGTLFIGLISGAYPALLLSKSTNLHDVNIKNGNMRQVLVFVQFLVSVSVISCAIQMYLQMKYIDQKSLGFEKENKLILNISSASYVEQIPVFRSQLLQNSNILNVSSSWSHLDRTISFEQAEVENSAGEFETLAYHWFNVDEHFIDTLDIRLLTGRNFDPAISTDRNRAIMVNQTLVERMGWENPIGKRLRYSLDAEPSYVVGVLEDFHFQGLQYEISPMILWFPLSEINRSYASRVLTIKISEGNTALALNFIREQWQSFYPDQPFEYEFLDDSLSEFYTTDINQMRLVALFAGLCIFVSCLGLFGLSVFTIDQRTKEIGIRKVLGASNFRIISILISSIARIVMIASMTASVIAYWIMSEWLDDFYYHDEINFWAFISAAILSAGIASVTMAVQSYNATTANPISALRYE